jgi:hypothetical protein
MTLTIIAASLVVIAAVKVAEFVLSFVYLPERNP